MTKRVNAPVCQSCRKAPAIKQVLTSNGGNRKLWKCKNCAERKSLSFIKHLDGKK